MPIGGSAVSWDEAVPAGSESIGLGDNRIRSLKTAIREGLDNEHVWPSDGTTVAIVGVHRAGSARAFWGLQSQVSSADTAGRLMISSDKSRLMSVATASAASVMMLGAGPLTPSFGSWLPVSYGTVPQTKGIAFESGKEATVSGRVLVTFPAAFDTPPFVIAQSTNSNFAAAGYSVHINNITASDFSAHVRDLDNILTASQTSVVWLAIGTRNL